MMKVQFKKERIRPLYPLSSNSFIASREQHKIALPTMEGFSFEKIEDIIYLAANSNYTHIYFRGNRQIMVCKTLKEIEETLNQYHQFIRIHRSHTINLNFLQKYIKGKHGQVVLENGTTLNVSAGQKLHFVAVMEWYFNF